MHQAPQGQVARRAPRPTHLARQPADIDGNTAAVLVGDDIALADDATQIIDHMLSVAARPWVALLYDCQRGVPQLHLGVTPFNESVASPAASRQWSAGVAL